MVWSDRFHEGDVGVDLDPSGKLLLTGGFDGVCVVVNAADGINANVAEYANDESLTHADTRAASPSTADAGATAGTAIRWSARGGGRGRRTGRWGSRRAGWTERCGTGTRRADEVADEVADFLKISLNVADPVRWHDRLLMTAASCPYRPSHGTRLVSHAATVEIARVVLAVRADDGGAPAASAGAVGRTARKRRCTFPAARVATGERHPPPGHSPSSPKRSAPATGRPSRAARHRARVASP